MEKAEKLTELVSIEQGENNTKLLARQIASLFSERQISEIQKNVENVKKLMSYYRCAILEVETKFKVLNEQFSLEHERNPIESIKSRLKSPESIGEKMHRKNLQINLSSLEENIFLVTRRSTEAFGARDNIRG